MVDEQPRTDAETLQRMEPLRVSSGGVCWWCRTNPASTGEHKFKRTDLARLMGDDDLLLWGDGEGQQREIRGKSGIQRDRHQVVKFPKSLCGDCNNSRSQPFDLAYDTYANHVDTHRFFRAAPWMNLSVIYGNDWPTESLSLAQYFAKHFGCRMARTRLPIPPSLIEFLDGTSSDMPDAHMAIASTDTIRKQYGKGLSISPDFVTTNKAFTKFNQYVLVSYIGGIGIRYDWRAEAIPDDERSQFFHFPGPLINYFRTEQDVALGNVRRPGWFPRLVQWAAT